MNVEEEVNPLMSSKKRLSESTGTKEKVKVNFLRPPAKKEEVLTREEKKRNKKLSNSSSGKKKGSDGG
mgnify:CR=1 FL=1